MAPRPIYEIRDGSSDDLPLYQETLYRALAWNPARVLPSLAHMMVHPEIVRFHQGWGRQGDLAVVAELAGMPVGAAFCRLFTDDDHGDGYVDSATPELAIAVSDGHRGRGVGTLLLDALAGRARAARFRQLSLSVDADNPACRLYERAGYEILSTDSRGVLMLKLL